MITVKRTIAIQHDGQRHRVRRAPAVTSTVEPGRIPRISRLMALAIQCERLLREGVVADQTALARLAHVSQPRMTQILNLLHLAPDIQEALLFLPRVEAGRDPISERELRQLVAMPDWRKQRQLFADFC